MAELYQGPIRCGPSEGADRGPFPRPTAQPDRPAAGVHPGGAVEGSEPAAAGQAPGGQPLDHPTGGRIGVGRKLQPSLESRARYRWATIAPARRLVISTPAEEGHPMGSVRAHETNIVLMDSILVFVSFISRHSTTLKTRIFPTLTRAGFFHKPFSR